MTIIPPTYTIKKAILTQGSLIIHIIILILKAISKRAKPILRSDDPNKKKNDIIHNIMGNLLIIILMSKKYLYFDSKSNALFCQLSL